MSQRSLFGPSTKQPWGVCERCGKSLQLRYDDRIGGVVSDHVCTFDVPLFGPVYPDELAGHNATDTSTEAAEAVSERLREKQLLVLDVIRKAADGATAHEVSPLVGMPVQSVNSRTNELAKLGHITDSGQRRKGPYGRNVIVWVAAER